MARKRIYDFSLPYDVGHLGMGILRSRLMGNPNYNQIPQEVRYKIEHSGSTKITEEDLNALPDHVWEEIARNANLAWHFGEEEPKYELGEEIGGSAPAPAPRAPVHQPDKAKVAEQKKTVQDHTQAVKEAAKKQPTPVSKGASTNKSAVSPSHGTGVKGKK
jgi:hypothetical protein